MKGWILFFVALALFAAAAAQSCGSLPSTGICAGYFRAGQTRYLDFEPLNFISQEELNSTFRSLDEYGLCQHCKENLKQFICGMAYPDCTLSVSFSGVNARVAIPSQFSCQAAINSCIPPDTPSFIRSEIEAAFTDVFSSVDDEVSNCSTLYSFIRSQATFSYFGVTVGISFNNISRAYDYAPNCSCVVPQNLTTCGEAVTYPVWTLVDALKTTFESEASSAIADISTALTSAGASCPNCTDQIRNSLCTAAFYRCAPDTSRLFIPPCSGVCTDLLTSCRIDQLNTPGLLATIRNISDASTANLISQAVSDCTKEPFLSVAESETNVSTNSSAADFRIRYYNSNNSIACQDGFYEARSRCPCVVANVTGTSCAAHVNYPVWAPINAAVSPLLPDLLDSLEPLSALCPNCLTAATKAVCQSIFPQCDADTVLRPVCSGDCEYQMSTCNVSVISSQCSVISSRLPFKASDFGEDCFTGGPRVTPTCEICTPIPATSACASYADWNMFSVIPSDFQTRIEGLALYFNSTINYPNCSECEYNLRKLYCTFTHIPCTAEVLDHVVSSVLAGASLSFDDIGSVFRLVDLPCYSECAATTAGCYSTLEADPQAAVVGCNSTSITLFGITFDFGGRIFTESPTCYRHGIATMPPQSCPVLRAPPVQPPVETRVESEPTVTTSELGATGGPGGVNPAAIAVPIVLILLAAIVAAIAVMYVKGMGPFKNRKKSSAADRDL